MSSWRSISEKRLLDSSAYALLRFLFVVGGVFFFQELPRYPFLHLTLPASVPLFDWPVFSSSVFAVAVKLILLMSVAAAAIGVYAHLASLLLSLSLFAFWMMYPNGAYEFTFFCPYALMAFALAEYLRARSSAQKAIPAETAFALLLAALYLTAGLEKWANFALMRAWLPHELIHWLRPEFFAVCPGLNCQALDVVLATVVPVEIAIGFLALWPRTRVFSAILAFAFHLGMYSVVGLRNIGFMVLGLQVAMPLLAEKASLRTVLGDRKLWLWLAALEPLLFLASRVSLGMAILSQVFQSAEVFLPLFLVCMRSYQRLGAWKIPSNWHLLRRWSFDGRSSLAAGALLAFLGFYSIYPAYEGFAKTMTFGWAMFSASYYRNPYYYYKTSDHSCRLPELPPYVDQVTKEGGIMFYGSLNPDFLSRYLKHYLGRCHLDQDLQIRSKYLDPENFRQSDQTKVMKAREN